MTRQKLEDAKKILSLSPIFHNWVPEKEREKLIFETARKLSLYSQKKESR